jgi:outer membrane receptor for ferric coprogen and ferric-rhodotorulic acid
MIPQTRILLVAFASVFALGAGLSAQTITPQSDSPTSQDSPQSRLEAPAGTAPKKEEDVLELSPFLVNAADDTGYRASSTLAGTRLRTDLRDVAASISVITKDFMNDIAANNLQDLLTYTAGTEVDGLAGNFSGSGFNSGGFQEFNGASRSVQGNTRVRGLGAADQTRDYFITDTPMDGYNIDRVEINRGPNAILFGLGRPGGIINSGLIRAMPNRTKTKVETQFDQESSKRLVFDHNQVLIKDVLALRF